MHQTFRVLARTAAGRNLISEFNETESAKAWDAFADARRRRSAAAIKGFTIVKLYSG
jgi:hypothetical protein